MGGGRAGVDRAVLTRQRPVSPTASRPRGAGDQRERGGPGGRLALARQRRAFAARDVDDQAVARTPVGALARPGHEVEITAPIRPPVHALLVHVLLLAVARIAHSRRQSRRKAPHEGAFSKIFRRCRRPPGVRRKTGRRYVAALPPETAEHDGMNPRETAATPRTMASEAIAGRMCRSWVMSSAWNAFRGQRARREL